MGMCSASRSPTPRREAGAVLACGVEVAEISPGEGVTLEDGTAIKAPTVICNADPKRMLAMLGGAEFDPDFRDPSRGVEGPQPGGQVQRLARAAARPGPRRPARIGRRGRRSTPPARWTRPRRAFERCAAGEPAVAFGEIYIQTGYDPSPAPEGKHLLSVFGQYAPYEHRRRRLGFRSRRRRPAVHRPDQPLRPRLSRTAWPSTRCSGRPTSSRGSGSPAATSSRARSRPTRCGRDGSPPARRSPGLYLCGAATHPGG